MMKGWSGNNSVSLNLGSLYSPKLRHMVIMEVITDGGLALGIYSKSVIHFTIISKSMKPKRTKSKTS